MGNENQKAKDNEPEKVTAVEKLEMVSAIISTWVEEFDPDRPIPKQRLNFSELVGVMKSKTPDLIAPMIGDGSLDPQRGLESQAPAFFIAMRGKFTKTGDRNIEDDKLEITRFVQAFNNEHYPHKLKKFTPSNVTGLDLYIITDGKVPLRKLGFNPTRMKLKHAQKEVIDPVLEEIRKQSA